MKVRKLLLKAELSFVKLSRILGPKNIWDFIRDFCRDAVQKWMIMKGMGSSHRIYR